MSCGLKYCLLAWINVSMLIHVHAYTYRRFAIQTQKTYEQFKREGYSNYSYFLDSVEKTFQRDLQIFIDIAPGNHAIISTTEIDFDIYIHEDNLFGYTFDCIFNNFIQTFGIPVENIKELAPLNNMHRYRLEVWFQKPISIDEWDVLMRLRMRIKDEIPNFENTADLIQLEYFSAPIISCILLTTTRTLAKHSPVELNTPSGVVNLTFWYMRIKPWPYEPDSSVHFTWRIDIRRITPKSGDVCSEIMKSINQSAPIIARSIVVCDSRLTSNKKASYTGVRLYADTRYINIESVGCGEIMKKKLVDILASDKIEVSTCITEIRDYEISLKMTRRYPTDLQTDSVDELTILDEIEQSISPHEPIAIRLKRYDIDRQVLDVQAVYEPRIFVGLDHKPTSILQYIRYTRYAMKMRRRSVNNDDLRAICHDEQLRRRGDGREEIGPHVRHSINNDKKANKAHIMIQKVPTNLVLLTSFLISSIFY